MADRPLPILAFLGQIWGQKSVWGMIWGDKMTHIARNCPRRFFINWLILW
ncbi:TPA: hypothetical protein ACHTJK_000531 [Citrobacter freundii]